MKVRRVPRLLLAGLLVAQCYGQAFAQKADFRPYGDVSIGHINWGKASPCGCEGANPTAAVGITLPGHLRVGIRAERVLTLGHSFWLGPEASFGLLPYERLRIVGSLRLPLRRDEREEMFSQVIDTDYSGYGSAFDLRYLPWAKRHEGRGWWLGVGYRSLTERTTIRFDGNLSTRSKVTHIGWSLGIGYQL